ALFELILSHNARIAPSNKLKNSSKMQVQNCGTYSFNITKKMLHRAINHRCGTFFKTPCPQKNDNNVFRNHRRNSKSGFA
uniref:hypothetical protein n=1 Tax=Alloprevotella sp. TaxID=1872471 RepID=UPI003FEEF491